MKSNITPAAATLAHKNSLELGILVGTGTDGRILIKDVEAAIAAKSEGNTSTPEAGVQEETPTIENETTAEETAGKKKEVERDGVTVSISVEEPSLPVGSRIVLAMIERRTGLPIRENMKLFGSEPYFLTDAVVPVVAVRVQKKKKGNGTREGFNPVLPQNVFDDLFGGSNLPTGSQESTDEFTHRVGIYSFDGAAQDRLRFSRGLDDEFGRNDLERSIRHWVMSMLGNPNISPGTFRLGIDEKGAHVRPENDADLPKAIERMFSKPKSINKALGLPPMGTIAMDRFTGNDQQFGQAFFPLSDFLTRSGSVSGGFQDYKIFGLFTTSDQKMAESKGGAVLEEYTKIVAEYKAQGAAVSAVNFRDMILGKFLSGVQRFTPSTMHSIREFLRTADELHARGASDAELEKESIRASKVLYDVSGQHILDVLEPKFLADACRLVGRRLNGTIEPSSLNPLAVHTSEGGIIVQDKRFTMAHCRDIMNGKHPMQGKLSKAIKMVAEHARAWHVGSVQDCAAALSGMKSYFCSRTRDRSSIMTFMVPMHLSEMNDRVRNMEVRPSFFLMQGPPVQVLDKSFGSRIPETLDGFFAKR